ncbi:type III pantothenate kinase [Lacimicrobium alkaliphilum]|uniref:Type III pantothenate kinase n=1 Tax=Lacimicrobium alkaliphilum TaxID=1526571 RepID=A0A0U3B6H0_9ALTE|nr:type III pantothenate kinase [Lacimicrobium alkaliphilum]ALS97269.1 hypothetical protein AT746_02580 [Lacimicrobium alkaliphilum]
MEVKSVSGPTNEYLCLDIGNSRVKFAMVTANEILCTGNLDDDNHLQKLLEQCKGVYIAAVGQPERLTRIMKTIKASHRPCQELHTSAQAFGLHCAYSNPAKLGLDRWLVMLGARRHSSKAFAVLDFGTAITCDFVDHNGQHHGGWICPGIQMMRQSLMQKTAQVTVNQQQWYPGNIGKDTEECVDSGCLALAKGLFDRAEQCLKNQFCDYEIFVCGGDSHRVVPDVTQRICHMPELIFYGMMNFIGEKPRFQAELL